MSDPAGEASPALPPAAFEITGYRRTIEAAAAPSPAVRAGLVAFVIATIALVTALVFMSRDPSSDTRDIASLVAIGVAGTGVLLALLVVLPLQLRTRERRRRAQQISTSLDGTATGLTAHLASIGYRIPHEVAVDWLASPDSTETVPLVHDSVIAARWWRPADGDERVFVEPYLRQDGADSSLPALPPLV